MEQGLAFPRLVPFRHRKGSAFHLQSRSDAIHGLESVALDVLAVGMQIDESRRHHQPANVHDLGALEWLSGNRSDLSIMKTHVTNRVEP